MTAPVEREAPILPALLGEMLDRLGIDGDRARGRAFAAASRRCLGCSKTAACGSWLESATTRKAAPPFCPNAGFLRRLAAERAAS